MTLKAFYDWQTNGGGGDVTRLIDVLERLEVSWCVIGGLAVNHWAAEPIVTADVDIVIALEDTLNGKLAAYSDKTRRPSKRQKDLLDILRLVESHPGLLSSVPDEIRQTSAFQNV